MAGFAGAFALSLASPAEAVGFGMDEPYYDESWEPAPVDYQEPTPVLESAPPEFQEPAPVLEPTPVESQEPAPDLAGSAAGGGTEQPGGTTAGTPADGVAENEAPAPPIEEGDLFGPDDANLTPEQQDARAQARQALNAALDEAERLLQRFPECAALVGGDGSGDSALRVLRTLRASRTQARIYAAPTVNMGSPGRVVWAEASAIGAGSKGWITFYRGFFTEPFGDAHQMEHINWATFGDESARPRTDQMFREYGGPPTPQELQAFTVLHELAHLMGTLYFEGGGFPPDFVEDFNAQIYRKCLRGNVEQPKRDDEEQEQEVEIVDAGLGGGLGFGGFLEPDPLPESDDPVIDFGSEAPALTDENGNVVEGGEVGEAYEDQYYDDLYGYEDPYSGESYDPGYGGGGDGSGGGGDDMVECYLYAYDYETDTAYFVCESGSMN